MTQKTHLYRHFDAQGRLLYVGISLSAVKRLSQHGKESRWANQIANVTIETLPSREDALEAERQAIIAERPLYNKTYNPRFGVLPAVPECFAWSSFTDDGDIIVVTLQGQFLDNEGDAFWYSVDNDGRVTFDTSHVAYLEMSDCVLEELSNFAVLAMEWYHEVETMEPTDRQLRRAYGHLKGIPPRLKWHFISRCDQAGCDLFAPGKDIL